jgi:2-hydroxychromene-2-carboxylate isomerase
MEESIAEDSSLALEFWFDFASPYSYLAASRIEALASARHLRLRWRPFLLGPIFKRRASNPSAFQETGSEERRYRRRDVERLCELYELPLSWPSGYPRGSLLATRVALIASYEEWCDAFARAVFTSNFADDRDIATEAVVMSILVGLRRNAQETVARAVLPETKARLAAQVDEAVAKGIFGAPSFMVGDELFWGNDRLEQAIEWACRPTVREVS